MPRWIAGFCSRIGVGKERGHFTGKHAVNSRPEVEQAGQHLGGAGYWKGGDGVKMVGGVKKRKAQKCQSCKIKGPGMVKLPVPWYSGEPRVCFHSQESCTLVGGIMGELGDEGEEGVRTEPWRRQQ